MADTICGFHEMPYCCTAISMLMMLMTLTDPEVVATVKWVSTFDLMTSHTWLHKLRMVFITRHSCTGRYYWQRVLPMGIVSVRPSVTTRYGFKARWDADSGYSSYDSLQYAVSQEVIWSHKLKRFPSNDDIKHEYPLRNRYFTTIGSSSVKTVADRHRLGAYHNKNCRRSFQWCQHRWPWTPK